jgi:squalene-hopene/tetraprenyl-beta-curcumene cyclase
LAYLRQQQEQNGAWFGRWGTNYIYGTWSVLAGFASAGIATDDPAIRKAVVWLNSTQGPDGGWGETNDSYQQADIDAQPHPSTAFHTALALLALLSEGETNSAAVLSGVIYLLKNQQLDGFWPDAGFNAPGFPKFFYLKYHGYPKFFPLWALARYRNLREAV